MTASEYFFKKMLFLWYEINIKSSISWKFEVDEPQGYRITKWRHQGEADLVLLQQLFKVTWPVIYQSQTSLFIEIVSRWKTKKIFYFPFKQVLKTGWTTQSYFLLHLPERPCKSMLVDKEEKSFYSTLEGNERNPSKALGLWLVASARAGP